MEYINFIGPVSIIIGLMTVLCVSLVRNFKKNEHWYTYEIEQHLHYALCDESANIIKCNTTKWEIIARRTKRYKENLTYYNL